MKKFLSILFLLIPVLSFAQKFSVANEKMNVFYLGVDNPFTVAVENTSCKDIVIRTDNGKITGNSCNYVYTGGRMGKAAILILKRSGDKLKEIGFTEFRVKNIPYPVAKIGPTGGGRIQKVSLKAQSYLRAELENFDIDIRMPVDSFHLTIIRKDSCVIKKLFNTGNKLSDEVREAIQSVGDDDVVIFDDIYCQHPIDGSIKLSPVILVVY